MSTPTGAAIEGRDILALPMRPNDADAATIRDYLVKLLTEVWELQDSFSGKRPFGNSGWDGYLMMPLIKAGFIVGKLDPEHGWLDECVDAEWAKGHRLIADAIKSLAVSDV